jgi:hypothetical protein
MAPPAGDQQSVISDDARKSSWTIGLPSDH